MDVDPTRDQERKQCLQAAGLELSSKNVTEADDYVTVWFNLDPKTDMEKVSHVIASSHQEIMRRQATKDWANPTLIYKFSYTCTHRDIASFAELGVKVCIELENP
ncbi:hypothetical protein EYZ11_009218 [Aspergillus tanneri]|uniref:Uncharacterized protein n=1 Tax=Aspergillus tanneri TaxID=1220188 RepID=A0A4S3J8K2_9EURO|nr:uncharacterized protein ATNIH1004_000288 [Aspergillus tanneri]KAA8651406.1 hypothetical protein ATNIH1004_000288 [Aspergillus tanneri]THC91316.1 hypothetical protein EYZ11_009218 [Aspergillus tanneri]